MWPYDFPVVVGAAGGGTSSDPVAASYSAHTVAGPIVLDPRFQAWPLGGAVETKALRKMANVGSTIARTGFVEEVVAFAVPSGIRIQRTATTTSAASFFLAVNLDHARTRQIAGENFFVAYDMRRGADYSGAGVSLDVYYSEEPEQAIINADGSFTNGSVSLYAGSAALPGAAYAGDDTPYYVLLTCPATATQACMVFEVTFSGTAGSDDYVEFSFAHMDVGTEPYAPLPRGLDSILQDGSRFVFSSYPYGAAPGTATPSPLGAVSSSAEANFSYVLNGVCPAMNYVPTFYAYSPLDGQDFKAHDKTGAASTNVMCYDLSNTGARITNNAVARFGREYSAHFVALALL